MKNNNNDSVKCQYITIDNDGNILASCDTLFEVSAFSRVQANKKFPFLSKILKTLKNKSNNKEPLFLPDVDFSYEGFHSICDFTFMESYDARGAKKTVWMIFDNSIHYQEFIRPGDKILKRTAGLLNFTLL